VQSLFADILSVLAMTYSDTQPRGTLRYRLLSASLLPVSSKLTEPGSWGHEYVRHLAAELGEEYSARTEGVAEPSVAGTDEAPDAKVEVKPAEVIGSMEDLQDLAVECAKFLLAHHAEPDAVDLLEELEMVHRIIELLDENTYVRVTQYMVASVLLSSTLPLEITLRCHVKMRESPPVTTRRYCVSAHGP
jgi:26S proteasome regulatory subunit N1